MHLTRQDEVLEKIKACNQENNIKMCYLSVKNENKSYYLNAYFVAGISSSNSGKSTIISLSNQDQWKISDSVESIKSKIKDCKESK